MADRFLHIGGTSKKTGNIYAAYAVVVLLGVFAAIISQQYLLIGLPLLFLTAYLCLTDFRSLFFLLLFFLPLSTEFYFMDSFSTDLPTEPLMVLLMFAFGLYALRHPRRISGSFIRHPLTLLVLSHLAWILIATLHSSLFWVSLKFSLAKTWYIVVFYFLAGFLLKDEADFKKLFWIVFLPLLATVIITLIRHSFYGFSFKDVYRVLDPYQRNHVNYAAMLSLFFPVLCFASGWYRKYSTRWWLIAGGIFLFICGIYFSYTRAAYISLVIALAAYVVIRLGLMRYLLLGSLTAALAGFLYLSTGDRYLEYAPNYDRTISHYEFDNLLEATYKMEDISTMERVYRWVAGFQMTAEKPVMGYGPGNFVNFYKSYTVTSFRTYVSDNEERSGIHSYFIMTLVEQGVIGLLLLIVLCLYPLLLAERLYHRVRSNGRRQLVMMIALMLVVINAFLIINDMLETDKVGPFFFIGLAVLVNISRPEQRKDQ